MSADLAPMMTESEARRITERIRTALDRVSTAWSDLAERITEAYERRADLALGYSSWSEYAEAELKPPSAIAAEVRRELVGLLSARGMSTRAIAPTVGVTQMTIVRDVKHDVSPERIDPITGEVVPAPTFPVTDVSDWTTEEIDEQMAEDDRVIADYESVTVPRPAPIVGLDGKTYSKPTNLVPRADPRRPLREGFRDASLDLGKLVDRFERLVGDDRYPRNRDEVAPYRNDLIRARDALDRLIEQMTTAPTGKATS